MITDPPANERSTFLVTAFVDRRETRLAMAAVALSAIGFLAALPFAGLPMPDVPAFLPAYVTALVICDAITAVLLFGHFYHLRSPALLALAGGYLFTASITAAYGLMFPGLLSPAGLLGAGPQSTSAMYMFWHAGFPLAVIGYAVLKRSIPASGGGSERDPLPAIGATVGGILAIVVACTVFTTAGHDLLPAFIAGNRTTDLGRLVLASDWLLCLAALAAVAARRRGTIV